MQKWDKIILWDELSFTFQHLTDFTYGKLLSKLRIQMVYYHTWNMTEVLSQFRQSQHILSDYYLMRSHHTKDCVPIFRWSAPSHAAEFAPWCWYFFWSWQNPYPSRRNITIYDWFSKQQNNSCTSAITFPITWSHQYLFSLEDKHSSILSTITIIGKETSTDFAGRVIQGYPWNCTGSIFIRPKTITSNCAFQWSSYITLVLIVVVTSIYIVHGAN